MSEFFFDDSKGHTYRNELDERRPVYRPRISPGKVTLTSRIVRAVPLATNNDHPAQIPPQAAAPIQRKAETSMQSEPGADSEMSAWDIAFRP